MTPDIDGDNFDSYNSDDFERGLKPCEVKLLNIRNVLNFL